MKNSKVRKILIIQNREEDTKFLYRSIRDNFPDFRITTYTNVLDAFSEIVYADYDLVLLDCDVQGYENNNGIRLIKSFKESVPIIVTCKEENKFMGLRSVVEGADNYYVIRYDYQRMLCKIISVSLNLTSIVDTIRDFKPEKFDIDESALKALATPA